MLKFYQVRNYGQSAFARFRRHKAYPRLQAQVKTIAVYKSGGGLGDLVQSTPLFRSLRQMFPCASIVYLGLYPKPYCDTLFRAIPYIDEYVEYVRPGRERSFGEYLRFVKTYFRKFDLIVDTQSKFGPSFYIWLLNPKYFLSRNPLFSNWKFMLNPRQKVHIAAKMLSSAAVLGIDNISFNPAIEISEDYLCLAQDYLRKFCGPYISIIPGAGHAYKMWGKDKVVHLADRLNSMGYRVILVGAERERGLLIEVAGAMKNKPIVPLLDEPKFGQDPIYSVGLFKLSCLTIGCDCGGLHLATLAGCPVIGIYGPTNPIKSGPLGASNVVIYRGLDCSPCSMSQCQINHSCLEEITPGQVIEAVEFILRSSNKQA